MLRISHNVTIAAEEIEFCPIRAQGSGGQNVNKVATAIHLRFDILASSLPEFYKSRLMALSDSRITKEGVVIIKAQSFRTQEKNRADALKRLQELICSVQNVPKQRVATKPSKGAKERRLKSKSKRSDVKAKRGKINDY